jgi:hypothetical protein
VEPGEAEIVRSALGRLGVTEGIRVVDDSDDELVLIVPSTVFPRLNERLLTRELADALDRKIWIVSESSDWDNKSQPLTD